MFTDMGVPLDARVLDQAFRAWLGEVMPRGTYRAWLVDAADGTVAGGGGITIIPWPPGPRYGGGRLAFGSKDYNEPPHPRRGPARPAADTNLPNGRDSGGGARQTNADAA